MDSLAAHCDDHRRTRLLQIEFRKARKRNKAIWLSALVAPALLLIALVAACLYGAEATARADALERSVSEGFRQSFYELTDHVSDMQVALKKLMVVSSAQQHVLLLSDVWRLSGAASENLSALPESHVTMQETSQFVTRTGDYAHALSRRILNGQTLSQTDQSQLRALYEASVRVSENLHWRIENDMLPTSALTLDGYYGEGTDTAVNTAQDENAGQSGEGQSEETKQDGESVSNYPSLIYDGPFSESTEKAEPRGLSGGEIDAAKAKEKALSFTGGGALEGAGETMGTIPCFMFTGTDGDERSVEVAVAKTGGAILWMMCETFGDEEGVPGEDVTSRYRADAARYLSERGYHDMKATYAQYYAGVAVLNFAATQDGVLLYADLVKVYVERATGKIVGVDANNYLFSHTARDLPAPAIDETAAAYSVSDALEVESTALALIPKTKNTEVLCYEFKGKCRGADFIVYINAETGAEEEVFEIINSEEGQLVV